MPNDKPEPLDDAAALFSNTHPGREHEALAAAIADARRKGTDVRQPAHYFAAWTHDQLATIKLTPTGEPLHTQPWCGDCDHERTRYRVDYNTGKILGRCHCWTPRKTAS
jgi:hypothetical protein